MKRLILLSALAALTMTCTQAPAPNRPATEVYFDNAGRGDVLGGGVKMIPINTPRGAFHVWTKRVGNNPTVKVLLLHGGPGFTHEYLEAFDSYLPGAGVEYYYYDQLGSAYSDQPDEAELWEIPRFVDEVEQVRKALELDGKDPASSGPAVGSPAGTELPTSRRSPSRRSSSAPVTTRWIPDSWR